MVDPSKQLAVAFAIWWVMAAVYAIALKRSGGGDVSGSDGGGDASDGGAD